MGWFKLGWETGKTAIKKGPEVIKAIKTIKGVKEIVNYVIIKE